MHNLIKVAFVMILPFSMFGQINFLKHYSDIGYDAGQGIVQLEDSSYAICGLSSSFNNGPSQAFMMKVDSNGNYLWSNQYGGYESESARRVLHKENFGYFLAGYSNSMGNGAYDFYLVKTDENGTKEWEKTYGTAGWEKVNDAALTRDTGVIMVGGTNSTITTGQDMFIVRTDKNGDTLWTKTLGGIGADEANCIEPYNDSLFMIGGYKWAEDSLKRKGMIIYLHDDGTIIDLDTLNNPGNWEVNDFTYYNDTLVGIGTYRDHPDSLSDAAFFIFKAFTFAIVPVGYYHTNAAGNSWGDLITAYGDGTKRYLGVTSADNSNIFPFGQDLLISKHSSTLNWLGQAASIAADYPDVGGQLISTSDGGAAAVGFREGVGEGGGTVFFLKIGPNETYPVTDNLVLTSQLVGIEDVVEFEYVKMYPNPASYSFNIELPNTDDYLVSVYNILGSKVLEKKASGNQAFDISQLSKGAYMVHIFRDNELINMKKLIIE